MVQSPTPRSTVIYWLIALLIVCRVIAALLYHPFDDAFITFRYSYNLIAGNGLVYNIGEWVLGTTAPVYALLAALVMSIGLPIPETMVAFNTMADVAILYLTIRHILPDRTDNGAVIFGTLFAGSLLLGRICVGAMEVNLFLLTGLVTILLFHQGSRRLAVAIAAAAYYIRPEAVVLVGMFGLLVLLERRWREVFVLAGIAVAVVLPGLVLLQIEYGHFLPHSVVAKSTFPKVPPTAVLRQFLAADWMMIALIPFAIWGAVLVARRPGIARTVALWGALHLLAYLVRRPFVWPWYAEVPGFAMVLLASIAMASLAGRLAGDSGRTAVTWATRGAALCVLVMWGYLFNRHGESSVETQVFDPMGRWAAETMTPATTIAAYDIGVIGYYSKANIFDLAGLVSPGLLQYPNMAAAIENRRAEYVMLVSTRETIALMSQPQLRQLYRPDRTFPESPPGEISMDSTLYHKQWTNNYIVFKRRDL